MLQGGVLCKTGLKRKVNQDRAGMLADGDTCLCYIADGMGGHYAGEKASGLIAQSLTDWWDGCHEAARRMPLQELAEHFKELLDGCASQLNREIPEDEYCGSTIVLLWLNGGQYLLLTAGDSRCYRLRRGLLRTEFCQMSTDDVYHAKGPEDAALEGKLTNCIGSQYTAHYTVQTGTAERRTLFALCSDGVYRCCPLVSLQAELAEAFRTDDLKPVLDRISAIVCSHGAPDNYSLVVAQIK